MRAARVVVAITMPVLVAWAGLGCSKVVPPGASPATPDVSPARPDTSPASSAFGEHDGQGRETRSAEDSAPTGAEADEGAESVAVGGTAAAGGAVGELPPGSAARPWSEPWHEIEAFRGASVIFGKGTALCAFGPKRTRCTLDDNGREIPLGALADSVITSLMNVSCHGYICGVGPEGRVLCDVRSAALAWLGTPRLVNIVGVTTHSAVHADGTLSVTSNRDCNDPGWTKVERVTDAVEVATDYQADQSCFRTRGGDIACVKHARDAVPKPVAGVRGAAHLWKTADALWVLKKDGDLLATRDLSGPMSTVARNIAAFTPVAYTTWRGGVPCAATRKGVLVCDFADQWKLSPVSGAGTTRAVFGGDHWICATDDRGTARCIVRPEAAAF